MINLRASVVTAWVLCGVVVVASTLNAVGILTPINPTLTQAKLVSDILWRIAPVVFVLPAALIISRQPRNIIGWLLMIPGLTFLLSTALTVYLLSFHPGPPPATPLNLLAVSIVSASWVGMIFPLLLIPLLFPNGKPVSRRWNWTLYLTGGMLVFFAFWIMFSRTVTPDFADWTMVNPIGFISAEMEMVLLGIWSVLLSLLALAGLVSIVARYRRAGPIERQQMKWLLFGCAMFGAFYASTVLFNLSETAFAKNGWFDILLFSSLIIIPIAMTIAILRYRLFDIDVIIRRTLVYGLMTLLLGLVYFGAVVLLQGLFGAALGEPSPVMIVLSTLLIAALANPLRRFLQERIDRRFYRRHYDAEQALGRFSAALRSEVDLDALNAMLVGVVLETLQPTQASVSLRTERKQGEPG